MNNFFSVLSKEKDFHEILREIQEYISSKYSTLILNQPDRQKEQLKYYITKYLQDYGLKSPGLTTEELIENSTQKWQSFLC